MAKPVIDKIAAFDCSYDYTFTFSCSGMQPNYNEVFIYDSEDLTEPVYHKLEASMSYKHTIKAENIIVVGSVDPVIDISVFGNQVGYAEGNYAFIYESGEWYLDSTQVDLTDYGIVVEEVAEGDNFVVNYTPPSGLINGKQYQVVMKCYGYDFQTESVLSDPLWFNCFTTPTLSFENINPSIINQITSSSLEVTLGYYQPEGEKLKDFQFRLLDAEKSLIKASEIFNSPDNYNYVYTMLSDNSTYWIEAFGHTEYDTEISIMVNIHVKYDIPSVHSIIRAEVEEGTGIVTYYTDIKIISPERSNYGFIDGEYIDLRDDSIDYKSGFAINDDYTLVIKLQEGFLGELVKILADTHISKLECIEVGDDIHCRYKLTVYDVEGFEYIIYSEELEMMEYNIENPVTEIVIQRTNSLYDLYVIRGGVL